MNKFIAAVVLAFTLIIPDPALSKPDIWSEECASHWSNSKAMAATQGKIIDMGQEMIDLFAAAAAKLPVHLMPPAEYHDAFGKARIAFLMLHSEHPVVYWVGVWDLDTCEGAAITLPKNIYDLIISKIGQPA